MKCASCGKDCGFYHECDKTITDINDGVRGSSTKDMRTTDIDTVHSQMDDQNKKNQRQQRGWGKTS